MPVTVNVEDKKKVHAARRLCELFRGRFSEEVGRKLIDDLGGELEAVDFVLNEEPSVVSKYLKESPNYVEDMRSDSKKIAHLLENGIEYEERQFACEACVSMWWKKVPCRKQVSKCFRCKTKYNPVPEDKQWGWAKFVCDCTNVFHAYGEMGVTLSKCYKCGFMVAVDMVLPPRRRIGSARKSNKPHSCNGVNCFGKHDDHIGHAMAKMTLSSHNSTHASHHNKITYNVQASTPPSGAGADGWQTKSAGGKEKNAASRGARGDSGGETPMCIHPKSTQSGRRQIRTPSKRHVSTGSTVNTFLSQGSLDTTAVSVAFTLDRIEEA